VSCLQLQLPFLVLPPARKQTRERQNAVMCTPHTPHIPQLCANCICMQSSRWRSLAGSLALCLTHSRSAYSSNSSSSDAMASTDDCRFIRSGQGCPAASPFSVLRVRACVGQHSTHSTHGHHTLSNTGPHTHARPFFAAAWDGSALRHMPCHASCLMPRRNGGRALWVHPPHARLYRGSPARLLPDALYRQIDDSLKAGAQHSSRSDQRCSDGDAM
jgi:hypothetical protein